MYQKQSISQLKIWLAEFFFKQLCKFLDFACNKNLFSIIGEGKAMSKKSIQKLLDGEFGDVFLNQKAIDEALMSGNAPFISKVIDSKINIENVNGIAVDSSLFCTHPSAFRLVLTLDKSIFYSERHRPSYVSGIGFNSHLYFEEISNYTSDNPLASFKNNNHYMRIIAKIFEADLPENFAIFVKLFYLDDAFKNYKSIGCRGKIEDILYEASITIKSPEMLDALFEQF